MDFNTYFNFDVTREIFQRGLAFLYLNGFLIAYNQFIALSGSNGLVPAKTFINRSSFERSPSLFFFNYQDWFFRFKRQIR